MVNKKLVNLIASAIVVNNLSATVVLGNDIGFDKYIEYNQGKSNKLNKSKTSSIKNVDKTISIEKYNEKLRERIVHNENEFISLIKNPNIHTIKLANDLDLTRFNEEDVVVNIDGVVIDGQGNDIKIPLVGKTQQDRFFTLAGNDITLKNVNFMVDDEYNKYLDKTVSAMKIIGDNVTLTNINIEGEQKNAINIEESTGVILENININGNESNTGILVDNSYVECKDVTINATKIGIEVIGRKADLTLDGDLTITSPIHVKSQTKGGSTVVDKLGQFENENKVFGYSYYKLADNKNIRLC